MVYSWTYNDPLRFINRPFKKIRIATMCVFSISYDGTIYIPQPWHHRDKKTELKSNDVNGVALR